MNISFRPQITSPEPGPSSPSEPPTLPCPPNPEPFPKPIEARGFFGAGDGVDLLAREASTTVVCPEGTSPTTSTSGNTVTITCEKPKANPGSAPILE